MSATVSAKLPARAPRAGEACRPNALGAAAGRSKVAAQSGRPSDLARPRLRMNTSLRPGRVSRVRRRAGPARPALRATRGLSFPGPPEHQLHLLLPDLMLGCPRGNLGSPPPPRPRPAGPAPAGTVAAARGPARGAPCAEFDVEGCRNHPSLRQPAGPRARLSDVGQRHTDLGLGARPLAADGASAQTCGPRERARKSHLRVWAALRAPGGLAGAPRRRCTWRLCPCVVLAGPGTFHLAPLQSSSAGLSSVPS